MRAKKLSIIVLSSIMVVINFYVLNQLGLFESRMARFATSLAFFILYAFFGGFIKVKLTVVFLMFVLTDFCILFYDYPLFNNLASLAKSLGLVFLSWHLFPKFKLEFESKRSILISLLLIVFSGVLFLELIGISTASFKDNIHKYLYGFSAFLVLLVLVLVVNYNFRNNSKKSILCLFFALAIASSDFSGFIYHYLQIDSFYYPTRLFYVVGLALFTAYGIFTFKKDDYYLEN